MRSNKTVAAMALFLALGACQTVPGRVVAPDLSAVLQPVPEPALEGSSNGDLARYALALKQGLREANARISTAADALKKAFPQ